jgi:hypothetical protein
MDWLVALRIPTPPRRGGEGRVRWGKMQRVASVHVTLPLRGSLPLRPNGAERACAARSMKPG